MKPPDDIDARAALPALTPPEAACRAAYAAFIERSYREEFGMLDPAQCALVVDDWFHPDARHDGHFAELRARAPEARRVLDLASGLGTAGLRGLSLGYDLFGVEPDADKAALVARRIDAGGFPAAWKARFPRAVGERLPFKSATFDALCSYQTLEHVGDPAAVLAEMLRVVRPGGALHLRCPDYRGTFEGHYLLPWLPYFPKRAARLYLRLLRRPVLGLEGIRYVSAPGLTCMLRAAARAQGRAVEVTDLERERLRQRLHGLRLPGWRTPALFWRAVFYAKRLFRAESHVNLWVKVG